MSDPNSNFSEKKSYQPPLCTRKSISETGEDTLRTPNTPALTGVQVLIVEGNNGDLLFIRQTSRTSAGQSGPSWLLKGEGFVEMRFADEEDADSRETFLLFDLRHRRPSGRRILESIEGNRDLGKAFPHVILATSLEQVHNRIGIDPKHCWQSRNCSSQSDLIAALRSFLHVCAEKNSPETSPPSMP